MDKHYVDPEITFKTQNNSSTEMEHRDYGLNKDLAMRKKLRFTDRVPMEIEESGGGINIRFNTGTYELMKSEIFQFFNADNRQYSSVVQIPVSDLDGNVVETKFKVKQSDSSLFTLNMYHTKCSYLVNGHDPWHFVEVDLPNIFKVIEDKLNEQDLSICDVNLQIKQILQDCKRTDRHTNVTINECRSTCVDAEGSSGEQKMTDEEQHQPCATVTENDISEQPRIESCDRPSVSMAEILHFIQSEVINLKSTFDHYIKVNDEKFSQLRDEIVSIKKQNSHLSRTTQDSLNALHESAQTVNAEVKNCTDSLHKRLQSVTDKLKNDNLSRRNEISYDNNGSVSFNKSKLNTKGSGRDHQLIDQQEICNNFESGGNIDRVSTRTSLDNSTSEFHRHQLGVSDQLKSKYADVIHHTNESQKSQSTTLSKNQGPILHQQETNPVSGGNRGPIATSTKSKNSSPVTVFANSGQSVQHKKQTEEVCSRTLIIGDSVLKGVNKRGLSDQTDIMSIGGAKTKDIAIGLKNWDMRAYSTVVIYVGGNDIATNTPDSIYSELYQTIEILKRRKNAVYLCTLCPRRDVDVVPLNDALKQLAQNTGVAVIDIYSSFIYGNGTVANNFYAQDGIHMNAKGSNTLVACINRIVTIIKNGSRTSNNGNNNHYPASYDSSASLQTKRKFCSHCHMSNHWTHECRRKTAGNVINGSRPTYTQRKHCTYCNMNNHWSNECTRQSRKPLMPRFRKGRDERHQTEKTTDGSMHGGLYQLRDTNYKYCVNCFCYDHFTKDCTYPNLNSTSNDSKQPNQGATNATYKTNVYEGIYC